MFDFNDFSFAFHQPLATGTIKTHPEDFRVHEKLGFELSGEGEHVFLLIEKRGLNTEEVVKALARSLNCSQNVISYAGMKDRQAITRQWFCIHSPGKEIDSPQLLMGNGWKVLEHKRHLKKLKKGALLGNSFQLIIRDILGVDEVENRLQEVQKYGVPNYFGEQRFGYDNQNLLKAKQVLLEGLKIKNHFLRGIYYSAARSFLFNQILSLRIREQSWNIALPGDVMQLAGSNSIFVAETIDELIKARVEIFDISPATVLWGRGEEKAKDRALLLQNQALEQYQVWCDALEQHGLERHYRANVLAVSEMFWEWQDNSLKLDFSLPAGGYATSVVRELIKLVA